MVRKLLGPIALALFVAAPGCKLCYTPYDYCAATVGPNGQPTGGFMTRRGSILGGDPTMPYFQAQVPTPAGQPTPAQPGGGPSMTSNPKSGEAIPASVTMPANANAPGDEAEE